MQVDISIVRRLVSFEIIVHKSGRKSRKRIQRERQRDADVNLLTDKFQQHGGPLLNRGVWARDSHKDVGRRLLQATRRSKLVS